MLENPRPFTTGLADLDRLLGPMGPKRLAVFAGISQSGMTTMLLTVARNAAVGQGIPTLFIDLESDRASIWDRLIAGEASVDHRRINSTVGEQARDVGVARALLMASPIQVRGPGLETVDTTRAVILSRKVRPRLVLIDGVRYLSDRDADRDDAMDRLAVSLKHLAGQLNLAVVVSHPLRHTPESERSPSLEHVGSGFGLVNHSDQFVIVHRPGLHVDRSAAGEAELRVMKNRHGPAGSVYVTAEMRFSRFVSSDPPMASAA